MRLALVEFAGRGGLIHYDVQLARALARRGIEVELLTDRHYELADLPVPFPVVRLFRLWDPKPAVPEHEFPRPLRRLARAARYYGAWAQLDRYLARHRPDAVLFGDIRFPADAVPLGLLRHKRHVLVDVCHNPEALDLEGREERDSADGGGRRRPYSLVYRQFHHVFIHYATNLDRFRSLYGPRDSSVTAIPHGDESLLLELRDPKVTADTLRRRLDIPAGDPVVLFFGTLRLHKGVDMLVDAFADILRTCPDAWLVVAGYPLADYPLAAIEAAARVRGVLSRTRFHYRYVPTPEVAAWMELARVLVLPYSASFQSGVLHLGLTAGVPIVATRVGATAEIVRQGETGLLVPPGDPEAFAHATSMLLTDPDLAARLAAAARRDSCTRFSWDTVAGRMLPVFEALTAGERA